MNLGQKLVFSIPNMEVMMERKYSNCINFEHTVFLTEPYIEFMLARHGFKLLAKEYFMEDHSIFYSAVRAGDIACSNLPKDLYKKNKDLYKNFVGYLKLLVNKLNHEINQTTQPIYLFGAHVFAQYLLELGLNKNKIQCLLDNDTKKHGRRLYGTMLNVASPIILADATNPIVILKAGVYNEEIKKDILENINDSTIFLE
jgi:hypothetical protein